MKPLNRIMASVVPDIAPGAPGTALFAATPPHAATCRHMPGIANRIDDFAPLDPAESFEFAGRDVSRNILAQAGQA